MNSINSDVVVNEIKQLMEKSAFMPQKLKEKLFKKLATPAISREKLDKIKSMLEKIVSTEDSAIKQVLAKDPMFFKNLKRQFSRKKLTKKLSEEMQIHADEMLLVEKELHNLLIT